MNLFISSFIGLGIFLRVDQLLIQTLIDDEWHAVHQILKNKPFDIFSSFGKSDYSIPLTLLYWIESQYFALTEFIMRLPIVIFGLITLVLAPLFISKKYSKFEAVIFSLFLSMSPVLIIYSQKARPYTITLFLVYFSIWAFYKCIKSDKKIVYGFMYVITAALAVWLHLIVAFFVVSPFIVELVKTFNKSRKTRIQKIKQLVAIGIPTFLITALLILPPLIHDLNALSSKSGKDVPNLDTLIGALHLSFGTRSELVVIIFSFLSLIGIKRVVSKSVIFINILVGFVITLMVIFIIQPAWVFHSITFLRYSLPIMPLLFIATASGGYYILNRINLYGKPIVQIIFIALVCVLYLKSSPVVDFIKQPSSTINHKVFIYEFRDGKNAFYNHISKRKTSAFWDTLSDTPYKYNITVAPWYFESYNWDAPIWEKISHQFILPGYLTGLCIEQRPGEVPNNKQFKFKNVSYLADKSDLTQREIDFIVYQKSFRLNFNNPYSKLDDCINTLKNNYGQPFFEDELIVVYKLTRPGEQIDK